MEAPLSCNTVNPYTQLDNVLLTYFIFIFFSTNTCECYFVHDLCHGSLVAQRGGETRAGGSDAARVLQAV